MKAPTVIGERLIDAHQLARHLFAANIESKVGREIDECTCAGAWRIELMIHDHEAIGATDLSHGERLTVGEQDSLRVPEDPRCCSAKQHHHEPGVHDEGEAPGAAEAVCVKKEAAVAVGVSGDAHLPAVALRFGCGGVGANTELGSCWQCSSKVDHSTPWQRLAEECVGLLGTRRRRRCCDLREAVPGADDDGNRQEN